MKNQDQLILEAIPDAVLLFDHNSRVIAGSKSARRMFGYAKREFSALSLPHLLTKYPAHTDPITIETLASCPTPVGTATAHTKKGRSILVQVFTRCIDGPDNPLYLVFLTPAEEKSAQETVTGSNPIQPAKTSRADRKLHGEIEIFREVIRLLISSLDPQAVLELILDHLQKVVLYDSASIMLLNGDSFSIVAQRKLLSPDQLAIRFTLQRHKHLREVVESKQPVIIPDTAQDPRWESMPGSNYIRNWLGVPLIGREQVIGLLNLDRVDPWRFTQDDAELSAAFGNYAAIAIENANLFLASRQAAERRAILHRVSQEIVSADLEAEEIYSAIHRATAQLMPAESFLIVLFHEEKQEFTAVYQIDRKRRMPVQTSAVTRGLITQISSSGHSISIADTADPNSRGELAQIDDPQAVRSILAVPMFLRGRVSGMIFTQSYSPTAYNPEDQNLMEMLASYAAIALENAALFKSIQHLASVDPLTGIYNRRKLFELGRAEFHRARRFHRPLSILMFDIDHFKRVNDTFGHSVGDVVLTKFAQVLKAGIRDIDILGRFGGEEFLILLPETRKTTAVAVANRLRSQIAAAFQNMYNGSIVLTASIGVVSMKDDTHSFTKLIEEADNALYGAKTLGRDRVKVSSD